MRTTSFRYRIWTGYAVLCIYCAVLFYAAFSAFKKPAYNWDMLAYMSVVLSYEGNSEMNAVHHQVYAIAKQQVPRMFYERMIDASNPYRASMVQSAAAFQSQMPFYVVKPLYTRLAYWFYRMGSTLSAATVWPSAISYMLTGLLFFHWCKKYWTIVCAFAGSCFVMLSPPLLTVAGLSTPDALSAMLLFTAVYLVTETSAVVCAYLLLLLSVFARLDNFLPAAAIIAVIVFTNRHRLTITPGASVLMVCLLLLAYITVAGNDRAYGWNILFYPAFIKQLNISYSANAVFSFSAYTALAKSQLASGFYFSFITLFLFLSVIYLSKLPFKRKELTLEEILVIFFVFIIAIRFVLQPLIADRLYIPYYLCLFVFLVKKNSRLQHGSYLIYEKVTV